MRYVEVAVALAVSLIAVAGCKRPVTGREFAGGEFRELRADPEFVRQGVPIRISFRIDGGVQEKITYTIAARTYECTPERLADGRYQCIHQGIDRVEFTAGATDLVLRAKNRLGKEVSASTRITLDFDCPEVKTLHVTPPIGAPGSRALVEIEANEVLGAPPVVSRGGRVWEAAQGEGTQWATDHVVTDDDPSSAIDVIVRLVDLAGNSSGDCGVDGRVPFSVDRIPPVVVADKIEVLRDVPGSPATISAEEGAFIDDVGVTEVHVVTRDESGQDTQVATLFPLSDGSLPSTPIEMPLTGRAYIQAFDVAFQASPTVLVRERWRLSVGMGEAMNAAIRTAVRYHPAPPRSTTLDNRTRELALSIFSEDTMSAVVDATVGFKEAGSLPTNYRNTEFIAAGYSRTAHAIVAFGGLIDDTTYRDETVIIRWNERTHTYEHQIFPAVSGATPTARAGTNIAFDDTGCGIMFGGFGAAGRYFDDVWQVCVGENGPVWTPIDDGPSPPTRFAPILWDPVLDRFAISYGSSGDDITDPIMILDPGDRTGPWRWVAMSELPDDLRSNYRYQHAFYYDTKVGGYAVGLGFTSFYRGDFWSFTHGEWVVSQYPFELWDRYGFGFAYDLARSYLVVWGDGRDVLGDIDDDVWILADDPREGAQAWRRVDFTPPVMRGNPTLVYDDDRETVVVFGGRRAFDTTPVPPDINVLVTQPSFPQLEADLDLQDTRPTGIGSLELTIRADGSGDGDGIGPGSTADGGVIVNLWDHDARRWDEVAVADTPPAGPPVTIPIVVTENAARYVSSDGVVPIAISTRHPATEEIGARLEIDLVDGALELSAEANPSAKVVAFEASPPNATSGEQVVLSWIVRDAPDGLTLNAGARQLATGLSLEGTFTDTPTVTTTYNLVARNAAHGDATLSRTVLVKPAIGAPIVLNFAAEEAAAPRSGTAHLHWTTDRASTVRILRGDLEVYRTTTALTSGLLDVALPGGTLTSTSFFIDATNATGTDLRSDEVRLANERVLVGPGASDSYVESISAIDEIDLYIVEMTEPGYIEAAVYSPTSGQCVSGVDTYMYLLDSNLESLGYNDDGPVGGCSAFERGIDRFILVPAGRYYVHVQQYDGSQLIPTYRLEITTTAIACGNGALEPGEACDDGNTTSNDGCTSTCRLEVAGTYAAPAGGHVVFPGSIAVAGRVQVFEVDVTAPTVVSFETFIAAAPSCASGDTLLEIYESDQTTLIASNDDDGVGYCSLLNVLLMPGTYYVVVHELGNNAAIPNYELVADSFAPSAAEVEPNASAAAATALGAIAPGSSTAITAGAINPENDEDWFSFSLSQTSSVRAAVFSDPTDQSVCIGDSTLTLLNALQVELANGDDENGSCPIVDGISGANPTLTGLAAGTYYLRVGAYNTNTIGVYYLVVEAQ